MHSASRCDTRLRLLCSSLRRILWFSMCMFPVSVKAAGVVQPAAGEEVSEGPGSRHLTGPASHRAHCDQRYPVVSGVGRLCYPVETWEMAQVQIRPPGYFRPLSIRQLSFCTAAYFNSWAAPAHTAASVKGRAFKTLKRKGFCCIKLLCLIQRHKGQTKWKHVSAKVVFLSEQQKWFMCHSWGGEMNLCAFLVTFTLTPIDPIDKLFKISFTRRCFSGTGWNMVLCCDMTHQTSTYIFFLVISDSVTIYMCAQLIRWLLQANKHEPMSLNHCVSADVSSHPACSHPSGGG